MRKFVQQLMFLGGLLLACAQLHAQATLSVQGTIQRSTGAAVDDGDYDITFRLYTAPTGGTPVWSETQSGVEIIGGVYSVALGSVNPLNAPFDQTYYLGISVGPGVEHTPRTLLTSAPYALSLLGQDNKFPSTGNVGIGTTTPGATLTVNGSIATETTTTTATSYNVAAGDHVIFLDHTANQNVTLPAASAANAGRHLVLVNKEAVAKTLTASNYLDITNATSTNVPANSVVELQSNGSVWRQTGGYVTPTAAAKAYVIAAPTAGANWSLSIYQSLPITEVEDPQNCFASSTFTAPRTGFYRVTAKIIGLNVTPWVANATMPMISVRCTGTCPWGVANRVLCAQQQQVGGTFGMCEFSADVYMAAGQTLSLQLGVTHFSLVGFSLYGNQADGSFITILEQ